MNSYKVLNKQVFSQGEFSLMPIRFEDRLDIMRWRNEQIYHLRQNKPLTEENQNKYFDTVVAELFEQEQPQQILFSYLQNDKCIGYGGLVHINWIDRNAEISFIMDTVLEENFFAFHWETYLSLIEEVAFTQLGIHKIYTYAFDLRPRLFDVLSRCSFNEEARLEQHCRFGGTYLDVLIHSKINKLKLRKAYVEDLNTTFLWASDPEIRKYSFNQTPISIDDHSSWFKNKLEDENCYYLILEDSLRNKLGSIRLDLLNNREGTISYLIDPIYHGRGLGKSILRLLEEYIIDHRLDIIALIGFVIPSNIASNRIFESLDYIKYVVGDNYKFVKIIR